MSHLFPFIFLNASHMEVNSYAYHEIGRAYGFQLGNGVVGKKDEDRD